MMNGSLTQTHLVKCSVVLGIPTTFNDTSKVQVCYWPNTMDNKNQMINLSRFTYKRKTHTLTNGNV